jgi:hypothetical protein
MGMLCSYTAMLLLYACVALSPAWCSLQRRLKRKGVPCDRFAVAELPQSLPGLKGTVSTWLCGIVSFT